MINASDQKKGEPLCITCRFGQLIRGYVESQEQTWCFLGKPIRPVPFPVSFCTDYEDKRIATKYDLEQIALVIEPGKGGRSPGFAAPECLTGEDEPNCPLPIPAKKILA